jgi:hypothetical protein
MSVSLKKLWNDYGIGGIFLALIGLYVLYMLYNYFMSKGSSGHEGQTGNTNKAYNNNPSSQQSQGVADANEFNNETFAAVAGSSSAPSPSTNTSSSDPSELLPKDTNSQWAQLNPVGGGEMGNINFLKAGALLGIDTVGQSLRNANQQLRSDPTIPQVAVGPWNQSTITPDFMRPPLEIGQGSQ